MKALWQVQTLGKLYTIMWLNNDKQQLYI